MKFTGWLLLLGAASYASAADTLVVAPAEMQPAMGDWLEYRRAQGRSIVVADAPRDFLSLQTLVRGAASQGALRYVVLVGDAPVRLASRNTALAPGVTPTGYAPAVVNRAWGGAPHIASDNLLADLDGDVSPELTIGRIPSRSPDELRAYLQRVIEREQSLDKEGASRVTVVASPGGFSPFLDSLIELTAQQAIRQLVPQRCEVCAMHASPASSHHPSIPFRMALQHGLRRSGLAWVYLGHGAQQMLDRVWDEPGAPPMLSTIDLEGFQEGPSPMIAALVACRTGRIDGPGDCLAERLVLSPGGPLAVVASSRVSMPYGNSVLGAELLACLFDQPECVGDCVAEGKRRALQEDSELPLRAALRQIGQGVSPQPGLLQTEVVEHVQMYNLLGDPLLRLSGQGAHERSVSRTSEPARLTL